MYCIRIRIKIHFFFCFLQTTPAIYATYASASFTQCATHTLTAKTYVRRVQAIQDRRTRTIIKRTQRITAQLRVRRIIIVPAIHEPVRRFVEIGSCGATKSNRVPRKPNLKPIGTVLRVSFSWKATTAKRYAKTLNFKQKILLIWTRDVIIAISSE